jgi:uncharacterized protein YciI
MPLRINRVIVTYAAGPSWTSGPPEDQADWDAHAAFVDDLIERGTFVMGGPFADNSGSLVMLAGVTAEQAPAIVADDPFMRNGVFELESVREWIVYVDELSSAHS